MANIVKPHRVYCCCGMYYIVLNSCRTKNIKCPVCNGKMIEVNVPHFKYIK